ncbi:MAG: TrkH family potassium uptake protein [Eubacteriales bacterium]|nr:TrkH family potassium uptake protein [Eubacteriales bacterium]
MALNYRAIVQILGVVMILLALSMVPSMAVSAIYHEQRAIFSFVVSILPMFAAGGFLFLISKPKSSVINLRDGMLIVSLSWFLASLCSCIPFMVSGSIPNFSEAFFESVSGFTTTGASIVSNIEGFAHGIVFWRSFTHWLGGMGILVFAIALLPSLGINGLRIAESEAPGPSFDKLTAKTSDSAKILYVMYIGMTIAETILLMFGGMTLFDALVHTFGTVGTGGFSSYGNGIVHFNSLYIELVIGFFMILAGNNFNLYYLLRKKNWRGFFGDTELRAYLAIIAASTLLIGIFLILFGTYSSFADSLRHGFFQTVSIITTSGFASADFELWPTCCKMILLFLMFVGGCSSSTSGSIKVIRIVVLFKLIRRGLYKRLHPLAVVPIKVSGKNVSPDTVSGIASFIFLYLSIFLVGTLALSLESLDLVTTLSSVATCLGNVGPGFGLVGPMANFELYSDPATFLLSFLMIIGRLELFTVLLLFTPAFWDPDRQL